VSENPLNNILVQVLLSTAVMNYLYGISVCIRRISGMTR